jgi:ribosomal protein S26
MGVNIYGCPYNLPPKFDDNQTTDLAKTDILNITNLTLGIKNKGKIKFKETVNLIDTDNNYSFIEIDKNINILHNLIEINSSAIPELNKSAILTLFNISFTKPKIYKDGKICSKCVINSYTNNILIFEVPSFTNYSASETVCGDSECDSGESCSNCAADCGSCPVVQTPVTSSSGGSAAYVKKIKEDKGKQKTQPPKQTEDDIDKEKEEKPSPQTQEINDDYAQQLPKEVAEETKFFFSLHLLWSLVIIPILLFVVYLRLKKKKHQYKKSVSNETYLIQLNDYIKKARKLGLSDDKIKSNLITVGWKKEVIEAAFTEK